MSNISASTYSFNSNISWNTALYLVLVLFNMICLIVNTLFKQGRYVSKLGCEVNNWKPVCERKCIA